VPPAPADDTQLCPPTYCPDPAGCDVATQTAELLRARLAAAALREPGGKLTPEAIGRVIDRFTLERDQHLAPNGLSALACDGALGNRRQLVLERLVTSRFAPLLDDHPPHLAAAGRLRVSRRVLPGFFRGLEDLAGVAFLEHCRERARELAEAVATEQGMAGLWVALPADPRARELVNELAVQLAPALLDPAANYPLVARRVINALPVGQADEDPALVFGWPHYLAMVRALFADLRAAYRDGGLGARLNTALDAEARANVARALLALDEAARDRDHGPPSGF